MLYVRVGVNKMLFFLIVLGVVCLGEILIWCMHSREKRNRNQMTKRSLYKLMEESVLSNILITRTSREQIAASEYNKLFLKVEFLDTKPWLAGIFDLNKCITIGRSRENMICIHDDILSRLHCKIVYMNGTLFLQDLGTANGTCIKRGPFQKIRLAPQQIEPLFAKDVILVGNYRMRISILQGWEAQI